MTNNFFNSNIDSKNKGFRRFTTKSVNFSALFTGVVYFNYDKSLDLYKIGCSRNIARRLEDRFNPWDFDLSKSFFIYVGDNAECYEQTIHAHFNRFRINPEKVDPSLKKIRQYGVF